MKLKISLFFLMIMLAGCSSDGEKSLQIKTDPPKRVILYISDAMPVGAPERVPLPVFQELKKQGTYYKEMYVSLAAHPKRNDNEDESSYYPWGCSLPNPVAMTGSIFVGKPGIKNHMIQHSFTERTTAFTVNCGSYEEISPGYTIYHQLEKNGFPDLFKDEMPVEDAREIIVNEDPAFIRIHMQGPGSGGHIVFQGADAHNQSHLKYAEDDGSIPWAQNIWHPKSPYVYHAQRVDSLLGDLVQWLESTGKMEETVLIVMGDHGQWDKGTHPPYAEKSNKTPFLILGKGIKKGVTYEYAEVLDLVPTIAFIANVSTPKYAQGRVLKECFIGGPQQLPEGRELKRLNQTLIEHHELISNHPEILENPEMSALNDKFLTIEEIGTWHKQFTDLESLLNHNEEILADLKKQVG